MPEKCERFRNARRGALPSLMLSSISVLFFQLGSAIVVHQCRLPYPRLKLFSFPLISFSVVDFHLLLQR